jgi:hypothetical protein
VREPARAAATLIPGRNRNTTTCESLQWLPCFRTKSSQGLSVSLIRVPQTQSTFHPHARQNAFRRRDARPQQKLFAWMNDLHVPKLFWETLAASPRRNICNLHENPGDYDSAWARIEATAAQRRAKARSQRERHCAARHARSRRLARGE